ncbi:unnamed protein product [Lactuca virosa]|uniref:Uncharacterized protein n=1 Tax=Lactuca virosa TaxID=75947 RepID=A0AAU9PUN5_9ASTR|nr:unnamed protein product [Lactuca virosa]
MVMYNKSRKVITFKMEQKVKKNLFKKQFCQILKLKVNGPFVVPSYDQILAMLNEMEHSPELTLINGILVPADVEVAEFSTLRIPKLLIDNPNDFTSIGRILEAMLSLVLVSNPVLIWYKEMVSDVSRALTPMKSKAKSKGLVIQEQTGEEHPQRTRKAAWVLKHFASKNLVTKPLPLRLKMMVFKTDDVIRTVDENEDTNT